MQAADGPALVCRALETVAPHLFTTRAWALGSAADGQSPAAWAAVAASIGVETDRLVRVHQVHGAAVRVHRRGDRSTAARPDADIILTDDSSSAVAIQTADCVPLLLADTRTGFVAAAHAGWRGLALRVPHAVVGALIRESGCRPADLVAAVGPSIGACCYEVGADVRDAFSSAAFDDGAIERWFLDRSRPTAANPSIEKAQGPPRAGHWFFDGWSAAREQLEAAGIPSAQIHVAELCTASHPATFPSYRRDGRGAGRLAAAIRRRQEAVP